VGRYWARWGDAVKEAGFRPNQFTAARTEDLLSHLAEVVREMGRFPVQADVELKARADPGSQVTAPSRGLVGNER
jgi:hypothetical protein